MKKFLAAAISAFLLTAATANINDISHNISVNATSMQTDDIVYLYKDNVLLKYTGTETSFDVPDFITEIDEEAFRGNETLTSITIHENVEKIAVGTFDTAFNLETVVISPLNQNYFSDGKAVYSVTRVVYDIMPNVPPGTFIDPMSLIKFLPGNKTSTYIVPKNTAEIADFAFINAYDLKELRLPPNVYEIGEYAFFNTDVSKIKIFVSKNSHTELCVKEKGWAYEYYSYGDINLDGVLNSMDLIALKQIILYKTGEFSEHYDLNSSGNINVADIIILKRHLAEWGGYKVLPV